MKKMPFLFVIILIVPTLIFTGCSNSTGIISQNNSKNTTVKSADNLLTVKTEASLESINSIEDLAKKSTVIVEGEIIGLDYFDFNSNTFTKAKLKVSNSFTDVVKAGDIISFVDAGGITTLDKVKLKDGYEGKPGAVSPITEQDKTTKVQVLFNGSPILKLHDKIILFGAEDKEDFYKLSEKYYDSVGTYQGRFKITNDMVERYTENPSENSTLKMKKSDLESRVKTVKNMK